MFHKMNRVIAGLCCVMLVVGLMAGCQTDGESITSSTQLSSVPSQPSEAPTIPTVPTVTKVSTATIGSTGDILMHEKVIKSGYDQETDTYNYDDIFTFFRKYVSAVDYAVANLEVTLCGTDNGFAYSGYPFI